MNLSKIEVKEVRMPICVDFDDTISVCAFPQTGEEVPGAVRVLNKWIEAGAGIVLDTMRGGQQLQDAVQWCQDHGIPLYGIVHDPTQHQWTSASKANGIFSVDDRNLGVPKMEYQGRQVVDWETIDRDYTPQVLKAIEEYDFDEWLILLKS